MPLIMMTESVKSKTMQQLIDFMPPSGVEVIPAHYRAGNTALTSPQLCETFLRSVWPSIECRESFYAVFLNQSLKPMSYAKIADGGISSVLVDVRILFKYAVDSMASGMVIAHNHPSGKFEASMHDEKLTNKIKLGCEILEFRLLDHIILMPESGFYSFAENGRV